MTAFDLETIAAMEERGGSFVKALANAARHADPENLAKIKVTFADYWQKYSALPLSSTGPALLERLKAYRASMAPHHRDRQGGKLLLEAINEIERLQQLL